MGRVQPKLLVLQKLLVLSEEQGSKVGMQAELLEEPEEADLDWKLGLDRVVLAYSLSCVNKHQRYLFIGNSAHSLTAVILFL